jgi:toxin ParE1/3/4
VSGYRLSPLALADLEAIWSYTAERGSQEQTESYHAMIVSACERLADGRAQGRRIDVRAGYWKCSVGSHLIFYRRSDSGIDVIRLLHQRIDIDRHL